jgi:Glycosyl hydrolase-like 10
MKEFADLQKRPDKKPEQPIQAPLQSDGIWPKPKKRVGNGSNYGQNVPGGLKDFGPYGHDAQASIQAQLMARAESKPELKDYLPDAVFVNAAGGALSDGKGGKAGLQQRVQTFSNGSVARTYFVPILTSDGRVGMNTTDDNPSKIHRDRKYEYKAKPGDILSPLRKERVFSRDVVNETRDALAANQFKVGKGKNDYHVVPWVESAFTTYIGRDGKGDAFLKDPSKTSGFTGKMQDKILTYTPTDPKTGKPMIDPKTGEKKRVPIEFMNEDGKKGSKTGNGYLDPLDPEVQKNVREVIMKAASKDYVPAIMVDDHFGIPLDKPNVRNAILERNPVSDEFLKKMERQGIDVNNKKNEKLIGDMWLRSEFTKFVNTVKAELKIKNVQLWASTNLPETAKASQGQDIETWIRTGLVDSWNVQLYRNNQSDFVSEYKKLQTQAGKIPQVAKGQVPVSVAISTYANNNPAYPKELSPSLMAEQVRYVEDKKNHTKVKTTSVAFGDDLWIEKARSQK